MNGSLGKRSLFSALLGTLLATLLLTSIPAAAKVRLTWSTWLGGDQLSVIQKRIEEFERQNPDIEVEILSFAGEDYRARLVTMFAAGTAPDVAHTVVYDAPWFIQNDMLLDVTRFAQEINQSDYFISDVYQPEGRVWGGFESHVQVYPIYYNPERFAEAGLMTPNEYYAAGDWTWETFRQVSRVLTRAMDDTIVQYGVRLPSGWETGWSIFGLANGAEFMNPERTTVTMNTPEMTEALRFMASLYHEDRVAPPPG